LLLATRLWREVHLAPFFVSAVHFGAGLITPAATAPMSRFLMPFSIPLSAAIYLTIWFTVLFAVLPFGVRSQHETGDIVAGTDPGAPVAPRLLAKALWTTFISAVIFAGVAVFAALSG
jgi:predicted secreted protein